MRTVFLLIGGLFVGLSPLPAFTQLGNGDLFLEGAADLAFDSNIFLGNADEESDFFASFYGGAGFLQADRSVLNLEFKLGLEVIRMLEFSEEDAEDWKSSILLSYPNNIERNGYFSMGAGWNENTQANADIGQRIESEDTYLNADFQQDLSDKFAFELNGSFTNVDYQNEAGPDSDFSFDRSSELNAIGVAGVYLYSERLSVLLSYTHRDLSYNDTISSGQKGDIFAIGGRGQLSPKITGAVSIGVQKTDLSSLVIPDQSNSDPFYSVDLTWTPRDKTSVSISGSSNFQNSVFGDVNNREDIQVQVSENLSDKSSLYGGILFSDNDYEGLFEREDESVMVFTGYFYSFDEETALTARASYEDRGSTLEGLGFDRLFISVGLSSLW